MAEEAGNPSVLRGNYDALVSWAKEAYAQGRSTSEVIETVYGVDLPAEAYAFHHAMFRDEDIQIEWFQEPWVLIRLNNSKYTPPPVSAWSSAQINNALSQDPDFLPLIQLGIGSASLDDHVIGYRISELRQQKTTICAHQDEIPPNSAEFKAVESSLLQALHNWLAERLRIATGQYESPSNRGAGSISHEDVETVASTLEKVKKLQNETRQGTSSEA
jgi:hypothetical protein